MSAKIDAQYCFLDQVAGWRQASGKGLTLTEPEGYFTLDPLPGTGTPLLDEEQQAAELVCPSALALDHCGGLVVVDAATNLIKRIDPVRKRVETLFAIGGANLAPRDLNQPRAVSVLKSGALVISDTARHRVKIFSPPPYALLQDWGGEPGRERGQFHYPWGLATDRCGKIFIADRRNHRVQVIARDGTWLEELGPHVLRAPTRLALGKEGLLAVVDVARNAVVIFPADRSSRPRLLREVAKPRSIAFDEEQNIYVGDDIGLIHVFAQDSSAHRGFRYLGAGATGLDHEIVDLLWDESLGLVAIVRENDGEPRLRLWVMNPAGSVTGTGQLITQPLESNLERCQWHRVSLAATVPSGTSITIESSTAEQSNADSPWTMCLRSADDNPDCLVQSAPGRFLRLRLTFNSDGIRSPELRSLKAFFPRASYLQYLPAVYQEDEESRFFLERFLSIFQAEFDGLDQRINRLWQLFDPASAESKYLLWLAGWLALEINPDWEEATLRLRIKNAFKNYLLRGTVGGLEQSISDYTDIPNVKILEHFRLRRWPALSLPAAPAEDDVPSWPPPSLSARLDGSAPLWSRDFYRRLQIGSNSQVGRFHLTGTPEPMLEPLAWGAHRFTVFFPADPYSVEETQRKMSRAVEREKPAHTVAEFCPVLPRFRIGVQATIGVDSAVGGVSHLVIGKLATLGYDSILACAKSEEQLRTFGATTRPRAGLSAQLL
jgi:phage tail-like protein